MPRDGRLSVEWPFPGLRPFEFSESEFFFGRTEQTYALYRLLELSRFVAVVGSSGSGKSSVVRAGLLPLLASESREIAASGLGAPWRWIEFRPGDAPLDRLADSLAALPVPTADEPEDPHRLAARRERIAYALRSSSFGLAETVAGNEALAGQRLLILVDQFEELFRYREATVHGGRFQNEAAQFVQLLLEATSGPSEEINVVITLRSDFIGDCARFYGLPEAVSGCQFLVPALTRNQREEIIRRPLESGQATIDPPLVEQLLNDAGNEFDQLPVLQHCLQRLWEESRLRAAPGAAPHLTLETYAAVGGIAHALSHHADRIMADDLKGDELAVEQVFRALSELDADNRATRRALPFSELLAETGVDERALRRVLDRFRAPDCSFIVPSPTAVADLAPDTRIDVGHEALLRRWDKISAEPALRAGSDRPTGGWLYQEADDRQTYRFLLALLEGGRTLPLDQVEKRWRWWTERPRTLAWADRYGGRRDEVEQLFANSRKELAAERFWKRTTRLGTAAAFLILVALGAFGWWQRREALVEKQQAVASAKLALAAKREAVARAADVKSMAGEIFKGDDQLVFKIVAPYLDAEGKPVHGAPAALLESILATVVDTAVELEQNHEASPGIRFDHGVALLKTADMQLVLGKNDASLGAARQAQKIFADLAKTQDDYANQKGLGIADQDIGNAYQALGKFDRALAFFQAEVALADAAAQHYPSKPEPKEDLWYGYQNEAVLLLTRNKPGDLDSALAALNRASAFTVVLAKLEPSETLWRHYLAEDYANVGDTLRHQHHFNQALDAYQTAITFNRECLAQKSPGDPQCEFDLGEVLDQAADIERQTGDNEASLKAAQQAQEALAALVRTRGTYSDNRELGVAYERIGDAYKALGQFDNAFAAYKQMLALDEAQAERYPSNIQTKEDLWDDYRDEASLLLARSKPGDLDLALKAYRKQITVSHQCLAQKSPDDTQCRDDLAEALGRAGYVELQMLDAKAALADDEAQLAIRQQQYQAAPTSASARSDLVDALGNTSFDLLFNHRPMDTLARADAALKLDPGAVWVETDRAHALLFLGRFDEAKAIYLKFKGQRLESGQTFAAAVKDDFAQFRKFGIDTPDMQRILALLN